MNVDIQVNNISLYSIISVIVPIRISTSHNVFDRLIYILGDISLDRTKIDFIIIDDGSSENYSNRILTLCKEYSYTYIYISSSSLPFSIARCRNIGAMYAKTKYIMFMDIDLYPYDGFYNDLINEISIQKLSDNANEFIMIGVIYLTKKASKSFFLLDIKIQKNFIIQKLLENDIEYIEKFSTGTSACLYNRYSYLGHGGNDEEFEGWGYEDLEYNLRMIRTRGKFPLPKDFSLDYKNFRMINEYKGWKSVYRLFGDITFQKGIVLTHIWHEVNQKNDYMKGKEKNRRLFEKKVDDFIRLKKEPEALPCMNSGKTLLFTKTNPFVYNRKTLPLFGKIYYVEEDIFDENSILEYLKTNEIDKVLMFNPYGSEHRLKLYRALKAKSIDIIVVERGALRDSVFYDWNGFNAESTSYQKELWDFSLSWDQYKQVDKYIQNEKKLDISLEKQKKLIGKNKLKQILNISSSKKILFVPMQRPSDSVIKYFMGKFGAYTDFCNLVQDTIDKLNDEWVVVIKKHPLEDKQILFHNVVYSDANIKDLLEMCNTILLINSGVGVLAMLWNKPVLYCGLVFYSDDRINKKVKNVEDVISVLESDFKPDKETIYRFLYYLLEKFYSFGKFETKEVPWEDTGRMTVTSGIDFYKIQNITTETLNFKNIGENYITKESILFDRYHSISFDDKKYRAEAKFKNKMNRLIKKFKNSPERYFKESRFFVLRIFGKIYWK